jgi:hypothetical protein
MDWEKQFKKYVWDDDKTPYFTPVSRLNRRQASNAFSMVCAAIVLGFTKHLLAAWYCGLAPVAALVYFYVFGFHPSSGAIDHVVILVIVALWLRYSWRVIGIGKYFDVMPEADDGKQSDDP